MDAAAFQERVMSEIVAGCGVLNLYIGHKLGYFKAISEAGSRVTVEQLSSATSSHPRYIKEWLECCAVNGYLLYEKESQSFVLPPGHAVALLNELDPSFVGSMTCWIPSVNSNDVLKPLLSAFKNGGGVPFQNYGQDAIEAIGKGNRPMFANEYCQEWIPKLPDIKTRLENGGKAIEIGCGVGFSAICLAKGFPSAIVEGLDIDEDSIKIAVQNAAAENLQGRVKFFCSDASSTNLEPGSYDLVTLFECLHDMAAPLEALKLMRSLVKPGVGAVLLADEHVEDDFCDMLPKDPTAVLPSFSEDPKNFRGRLNYGFSVLHCLPQSMVFPGSAAIGTVIRPALVQKLALEAGFTAVNVVHENASWKFYRLEC
eukprot:GILK01007642.1.p1 GENE.GILK01007642.1~~GILK01007642.1.p1  ORF type:complete len:370 (-),score=38.37 GILK01007642.1:72-1181(-)